MKSLDPIDQYCENHSSSPSPILRELERASHLRTLSPQMIAGPYQGLLLRFISQMIKPDRILEIGTFTGYGAICLAEGLQTNGKLHTIEVDEEREPMIREFLEKAGISDKVELSIGNALELLQQLEPGFDLIFLDAGKLDYLDYYQLCIPLLRPGGFLLADNVLWDGKVLTEDEDATTQTLQRFNDLVTQDPAVENLLLPIRDGLMLIRKNES